MFVAQLKKDRSIIKPRILICANSYPPQVGGLATYSTQLAQNLAKFNYDVTVLAPTSHAYKSCDRKISYNILRYSSKIDLYQKCFIEMLSTDLVFIVQRGNFLSLAYYINKLLCRPYVVALHGHEIQSRKRTGIIKKMSQASAITAVSSYTANHFKALGIEPSLITVINNGTAPIKNWDEGIRRQYNLDGKQIILTVARLIKHKGQDHLLKSLPKILNIFPNAHYLMVGDGPDRQYLENLAFNELNLRESVTFAGAISDKSVAACYHACDLFAMISRQHKNSVEGFGIVFLEAGSAGKAVVGGDSGGIRDAVEQNKTGVLVNPNALDEIATSIIDLLQNKNKRMKYGENGRKRVIEGFTWEKVAKKYAKLFDSILARSKYD
jgi:phosphatidyl-myo-inositol dimannoside synthase